MNKLDQDVVQSLFALNIIYIGETLRLFPDAKFILIPRQPADCVLSCYMQMFYEGPAHANFYNLEAAASASFSGSRNRSLIHRVSASCCSRPETSILVRPSA